VTEREFLTPEWEATGQQYRQQLAAIEATERRLANNPPALRAFHREQARLLDQTRRNYQAAHPSSGCVTMLGLLGLVGWFGLRKMRAQR
jgi:hypothetical protein